MDKIHEKEEFTATERSAEFLIDNTFIEEGSYYQIARTLVENKEEILKILNNG